MMKKNRITLKYIALPLLIVSIVLSSCSDDPIPLRNPNETGNKVDFTWEATADSMQTATYKAYLGSEGTFNKDNNGNSTFNYWPNAHVLNALVDGYTRTGDAAYLPKMKALLKGIKSKNGGTYNNVFNDDKLWLANASARAYVATNDEAYKEVADYLWENVKMSRSNVFGGGITWKTNTPKQKNAVSNGPAAVLAMRLYQIDGNEEDLQAAKDIYQWEKNNLVDPSTGLVWDNISEKNGETVVQKDWVFTYNMGTYIGAGVKLYDATGDQTYLNDALKSAKTLIKSPKLTTEGLLKDEGQGDGGLFKGILIRYFTQLILEPDVKESDKKDFVDFLKFNAQTFYKDGLKRPEMIAGPNWRELPSGKTDLTTQLSGLMLMEAAAKLKKDSIF